MSQTQFQKRPQQTMVEYSIYAFRRNNNPRAGEIWEKIGVMYDMREAIQTAERFIANVDGCRRVEVKQKYYDRNQAQHVESTLKSFDGKRCMKSACLSIGAISVFISMIVFALSKLG